MEGLEDTKSPDPVTRSRPTCGVELNKLQVLAGKACPGDHGGAITGAGVGRCAAEVGTPVASGKHRGQHRER